MTQPPSDKLFELFNQALDLEQEERETFLNNLRQEDPELEIEVQRLLSKFDEEEDFFDKPLFPGLSEALKNATHEMVEDPDEQMTDIKPGATGPEPEPFFQKPRKDTLDVPERIGPYPIIRPIGVGGMGTVYLAKQLDPEREVALKLINSSRVSDEFLARFESEYRVLALMNHNNIARIYQAGNIRDGSMYFTMEYVDGSPINRFCREHDFNVRQRLTLFQQVCDGVLHAHQKAVVHRDLKPSNILVAMENGQPVVKLIDFGIAKDLDPETTTRSFETRTGMFIGTRDYMSPEQMRGEKETPDTRSDIYSLGVLLYELLTGLLPFDHNHFQGMAPDEVLRVYREEDPSWPSKRLEAFHRERAGQTVMTDVSGFLVRLKGELDWIVMKAMEKDPNRRYPTVAALKEDIDNFLNGEAILARPPSMVYKLRKFTSRNRVLVGLASMTFFALIAALFISIWSAKQTAIANKNLRHTNDFLLEMLSEPDPHNKGIEARVVDVLVNAEKSLDEGAGQGGEFEATIRKTLGNTYFGLGQYKKAVKHLNITQQILTRLRGDQDQETLKARYYYARALRRDRQYESASQIYKDVYEVQKRILGPNHRDTLKSLFGQAVVMRILRRYPEADRLYKDVWSRQSQAFGEKDTDALMSMVGSANVTYMMDFHNEAASIYNKALELQREVIGPDKPETLSTMYNLAHCYHALGEYQKAETLLAECTETRKQTLGPEHPLTLSSLDYLAKTIRALERYDEAEILLREILQKRKEIRGLENEQTLRTLNSLGLTMVLAGKCREASENYEGMLEIVNRLGLQSMAAIWGNQNMGKTQICLGNFDEAAHFLQKAQAIGEKANGSKALSTLEIIGDMGSLEYKRKNFKASLSKYSDVIEKMNPDHPRFAFYEGRYGYILLKLNRLVEAEAALISALDKASSLNIERDKILDCLIELYQLMDHQEKLNHFRSLKGQ